jgi:hypothetical protein
MEDNSNRSKDSSGNVYPKKANLDSNSGENDIYHSSAQKSGAINNSKKKKWLFILLATTGAIALIFVLLLVFVYIGLRRIVANSPQNVDPKDQKVIVLRGQAKRDIDNAFNGVNTDLNTSPVAKSVIDQCYRGQNNSEVKDNYVNKCTIRITQYYGFNTDFRTTMLNLEQNLEKQGWLFNGGLSISTMIGEYYDKYYGPNNPKPLSHKDTYLVSDLPQVRATIPKNNFETSFMYAEKTTKTPEDIELNQQIGTGTLNITYNSEEKVDPQSVFNSILKDNKFLIGISISSSYYSN